MILAGERVIRTFYPSRRAGGMADAGRWPQPRLESCAVVGAFATGAVSMGVLPAYGSSSRLPLSTNPA